MAEARSRLMIMSSSKEVQAWLDLAWARVCSLAWKLVVVL